MVAWWVKPIKLKMTFWLIIYTKAYIVTDKVETFNNKFYIVFLISTSYWSFLKTSDVCLVSLQGCIKLK